MIPDSRMVPAPPASDKIPRPVDVGEGVRYRWVIDRVMELAPNRRYRLMAPTQGTSA
jgi:hypothetical protein